MTFKNPSVFEGIVIILVSSGIIIAIGEVFPRVFEYGILSFCVLSMLSVLLLAIRTILLKSQLNKEIESDEWKLVFLVCLILIWEGLVLIFSKDFIMRRNALILGIFAVVPWIGFIPEIVK